MKKTISAIILCLSLNSWAQNNESNSNDLIIEAVLSTIEAAFKGFPEAEQPINSFKVEPIETARIKDKHFEVYFSDTIFYSAVLADYGYETVFKIHKELIVNNRALELVDKYSEIYVVHEYMDLNGNWIKVYCEAEKKDLKYESLIFYN